MAKKSKMSGMKMSQKLSAGTSTGSSGLDVGSKLEKASTVPYKGYKTTGLSHGAHGVLAGTGGKKSAKIPNSGGSNGR